MSSSESKQANMTTSTTGDAAQRVTIRDVARRAGVSPASVSLTLSGRGRISDETRERILEVVDELNYQPPRRKKRSADLRVFTVPSGGMHGGIDRAAELESLQLEMEQRNQEGFDTGEIEQQFERLALATPSLNDLETLYSRIDTLSMRSDYPYYEPSDWDEISSEASDVLVSDAYFASDELYDRIYGGWLGRCIGCTLGRPLELMGSYEAIEEFLERGGAYPLDDYVPEILPAPEVYTGTEPAMRHFLRGNIQYAPRDDDLDYTILNLRILERYGANFTSEQVADTWLRHLAYNNIYTAERAAYANLVKQYGPPDTALHRNPYREFIGAQIRADIFGYTLPGQPRTAAQHAWRDARISHVKNGLYGAMMVSAMISAAFVTSDVEEIVRIGLKVVPERSRMAAVIRETLDQSANADNWQEVAAYISEAFAEYDPIHVLPNTCIVVLALLAGQGDFERSVTIAAMCGMDSDCNAATVGSIVGVLNGVAAIPVKWSRPLNDQLESWVRGECRNSISDLAARTLNIARHMLTGDR
jgi:ADP-ribosylglycohydrolase/transcriptional regulator with XRE-family HTH domain